ncbi:pumilio homolog 24 isoform X2 [Cryptomeria japonica]|uniref:pumilio homolog 24 isoform X2 n=1 Tax=Cryptomeria japonica TaxID=3369 RepID=UPI0027DA46B8|nr:pumilio homolog 24 isoform X2 [Cryptomeria japonica]
MAADAPHKSKKRKSVSDGNSDAGKTFRNDWKTNTSPAKKMKHSKTEGNDYNKPVKKGSTKPLKPKFETKSLKPKFDKSKNKHLAHAERPKIPSDKTTMVPDANATKQDRKKWKELTENRKRKRKPHYDLQKELVASWEKMRQRNIELEERSKLISETLSKMKGKIPDIAGSHVSSRVLQTCVKYCQPAERDTVYEELRPHFLKLACNTYAVHLVTKMLDHANKEQRQGMISSLHGHVASFLRHPVGSAVVEHAYKLGNATQKQDLLSEIYSAEFRLFKGIIPKGKGRLADFLSGELPSKKNAVLEHMTLALQPILEKGIVDHSIVHRGLMEYMSIADKTSVTDVIQQLSGPLLVRIIHTRDGSKVGATCVIHGNAKERKRIVKGMKGHAVKIACDEYGSVVLMCILSFVDDTSVVNKVIIRAIEKNLKELALDKYGQRPLLHLLCPNARRYFPPDVLATLRLTITSLSTSTEEELSKHGHIEDSGHQTRPSETVNPIPSNDENDQSQKMEDKIEVDVEENNSLEKTSRKDPYTRRFELLIKSGLAQIATGGAESILWKEAAGFVTSLHRAIADVGALPQVNDGVQADEHVVNDGVQADEHVFIQYHSSRTIRKLIMESHVPDGIDAPSFASILWDVALKGKCKMWAQGHSAKVVSALMNSADRKVRKKAKPELQPLIDAGMLKVQNGNI